jgi:hypothetical protein
MFMKIDDLLLIIRDLFFRQAMPTSRTHSAREFTNQADPSLSRFRQNKLATLPPAFGK